VQNAIILAAGFGSRCVPLTYETPKGLLAVHGKPMIERQIEQLLEKGIKEIIIVVGYQKEKFDYLVDLYGAKLVFNREYSVKNNLSSLYCALPWLGSSYVTMSDFWIDNNIFNACEARSWYSCNFIDGKTGEWCIDTSPSGRIENITVGGSDSYAIVGPAYFDPSFSEKFKKIIEDYYNRPGTEDLYWEHALIDNISSLPIYINKQTGNVHEFENLEELRRFDPSYNLESNNKIMRSIASLYDVSEDKIHGIEPIKKGMTNDSFKFVIGDTAYVYRTPGAGTEKLIDRKREYDAYQAIIPHKISDEIVSLDPENGNKITVFFEDARVCDPLNFEDVQKCMDKLKKFHGLRLFVSHTFNIFGQVEYYESLWLTPESAFKDYKQTKINVMRLKEFVDAAEKDFCLTHIDAVPDNFLFIGENEIRLIDWEYAGMQDPHVDIAMFAVYSMYERENVERLIDCYFNGECPKQTRLKIYAYIAMCGLLWSNWCEYKSQLGIEFGEYALAQYRFAKDYYKIFNEERD